VAEMFAIRLLGWNAGAGHAGVLAKRSPQFRVRPHEDQSNAGFLVTVLVSVECDMTLRSDLNIGEDEEDARLDQVMVIFGLRQIEAHIRNRTWDTSTQSVEPLRLGMEDLDELAGLVHDKECDYQLREGRDLYCSAASRSDETMVGSLGVRAIAPTSTAMCRRCDLPDSRVICSQLRHPEVFGTVLSNGPVSRHLSAAVCDIGRDEIARPSKCRPGGNACWVRVVGPEAAAAAVILPARAMTESLDYLDTAWRLAFNAPLLRLRSAALVADLGAGTSSREDFQSRISALSDVMKGFDVGDELLPTGMTLDKDHTLARLRAVLAARLDDEALAEAKGALDTLTAAARVRAAMQHGPAAPELPARLAVLGVPFPPSDWGNAWDIVRSRVASAWRQLAEVVRALAVGTVRNS
jgi:hypothetical protein